MLRQARADLGLVYVNLKQYAQAVEELRQSLSSDATRTVKGVRALDLGLALLENRQFPEAAAALQQAVNELPDVALAYHGLGLALTGNTIN